MGNPSSLLSVQISSVPQIAANTRSIFRVSVVVNDPQNLDQVLDQAVQRLIPAAIERGHGILVTQVSPTKYTVEVDGGVLCGMTREKRLEP